MIAKTTWFFIRKPGYNTCIKHSQDKRMHMGKQLKKVGTHSGKFHADEVMSTALLKELFDLEVIRSRDTDVLKDLDLIYDIGEGEFDHHQMDKRVRENGTPYAACGLIWERFGREIVKGFDQTVSEEDLETIFKDIDRMMIEGIDAADNGLKTTKMIIPTLNISTIISKFNPTWELEMAQDSAFNDAVKFASEVFRNILKHKFAVIRAKGAILKAYDNRIIPEILVLDRMYPWNAMIHDIDKEGKLLFVIYPDSNNYVIQTIRKNDGTYGDIKPLPLSWAGKRDEELSGITGVDDAVFCHSHRFIASAKSQEGILKMAQLALAEPEEPEYTSEEGFIEALRGFLLSGCVRIHL